MKYFFIVFFVLIFFFAPANAGVIVYELFTARDCPACPRADELFRQIAAKNPYIISLSCHVTYFDRPGRADSLSAPFCDGRQAGYKQSHVVNRLFTPAAVVNGAQGVKGNDADNLFAALKEGGAGSVQPIHLSRQGDGYLNITLPNIGMRDAADVWLFAYDDNNAVTFLTKLMRWNGKAVAMAFPVSTIDAEGFAVIAQTAAQTDILAAGKTN